MPKVLLAERGRGTRPSKLQPINGARTDYNDEALHGFQVRVTPNGVRTYAVWYRFRGKARRLTIGPVEAWSLAEARARAAEVIRDARRGVDAVVTKHHARAEAQKRKVGGESFEALARRCLDQDSGRLRPATLAAYMRTLERDVFPRIGRIPPSEITRGHIRAVVDDLAVRAPIQANRTLAVVKRIFSWAVSKDLLAADPCAGVRRPSAERHLERNFSNDEIRAIFDALPGTGLEYLVPLLFYTAVRSQEGRGARWTEFDFERAVWTIPAVRRKQRQLSARDLPLPLPGPALALLRRIPRFSEFLFPAGTVSGYIGPPRAGIELLRERSGVTDFRLHFIRHTVRSRLPEVGVAPDIAERVLGHAITGLRAVYDQADYAPQVRRAVEAWAAALDRILSGAQATGKVAAFSRTRR